MPLQNVLTLFECQANVRHFISPPESMGQDFAIATNPLCYINVTLMSQAGYIMGAITPKQAKPEQSHCLETLITELNIGDQIV